MVSYKNLNGNGGVSAYETGDDFIRLRFGKERKAYLYNYSKPGKKHVDKMKKLAISGTGLTTYVNQYVRDNYAAVSS